MTFFVHLAALGRLSSFCAAVLTRVFRPVEPAPPNERWFWERPSLYGTISPSYPPKFPCSYLQYVPRFLVSFSLGLIAQTHTDTVITNKINLFTKQKALSANRRIFFNHEWNVNIKSWKVIEKKKIRDWSENLVWLVSLCLDIRWRFFLMDILQKRWTNCAQLFSSKEAVVRFIILHVGRPISL